MLWFIFLIINVAHAQQYNPNPCKNGGTYIESGENTGACECKRGTMGPHCEGFGCENEYKCNGHFVGQCLDPIIEEDIDVWQCSSNNWHYDSDSGNIYQGNTIFTDELIDGGTNSDMFPNLRGHVSTFTCSLGDKLTLNLPSVGSYDWYYPYQCKGKYYNTGTTTRVIFGDDMNKDICGEGTNSSKTTIVGKRQKCNRFLLNRGQCHGTVTSLCSQKCRQGFTGDLCNICEGCNSCKNKYALVNDATFLTKKSYTVKMEEKPETLNGFEYNTVPAHAVMVSNANTVTECYTKCMTPNATVESEPYRKRLQSGTTWVDRHNWDSNTYLEDTLGITIPEIYSLRDGDKVDRNKDSYYKGDYYWYRYDNVYTGRRQWQTVYIGEQSEGMVSSDPFTGEITDDRQWTSLYKHCDMDVIRNDTDEPICFTTGDIPRYVYTMGEEFWNKYTNQDVTHFEFIPGIKHETRVADTDEIPLGTCICYTASEADVGVSKTSTFNPDTFWDDFGTKNVTSKVVKVPDKPSYFLEKENICIQCRDDEMPYGSHCCPIGYYGDYCEHLYDGSPCATGPCGDKVCLDASNQTEDSGVIPFGSFACICPEGKAGVDCDIDCCVRGSSVSAYPSTTVNGECNMATGACECDYGYSGLHCQCSDSMCGNGVCNPELKHDDTANMCVCHPGYELDTDGKCTIDSDDCAGNPCFHGDCVNLLGGYSCECHVGYSGEDCSVDLGWNQNNVTCNVDEYLVNGRCLDCPVGTYSKNPTDDRCRVILTDDNIRDAVKDAMCEHDVCEYKTPTRVYRYCNSGIYTQGSVKHESVFLKMDSGPLMYYDSYMNKCRDLCMSGSDAEIDDTIYRGIYNHGMYDTFWDNFNVSDIKAFAVTPYNPSSVYYDEEKWHCECIVQDPYSPQCKFQAQHNGHGGDFSLLSSHVGSNIKEGDRVWEVDHGSYVLQHREAFVYAINREKRVNLYGDIETFDTSRVTNMDGLFLNKAVPDISGWDISSVTSMRNMFAGSTGVFDKWSIAESVDTTNIYAGSDLEQQFVEKKSGSCLDNPDIRPVVSSLECFHAHYDATTKFSSEVTVRNLLPSGRAGCTYHASQSHELTFRALNISNLETCTAEFPCLCAKIRPGEYVEANTCTDMYEPITTVEQCTIAVRHLSEFSGVKQLSNGVCEMDGKKVCMMREYPSCDNSSTTCIHNGLLCKSGVVIDDTCKVDNDALRDMVQFWSLYPDTSEWLYGLLKNWDVHYVTNMTNLFTNGNPDIRQWDMSNVVHADKMLYDSNFNYPLDNKDLSSLQTAAQMFPPDYGYRKCGKHFARARANAEGVFGEHGKCLNSSNIKDAVSNWFDGNRTTVTKDYGHMSDWDVSEVTDMTELFQSRENISSLAKWDTGKVTSMVSMFKYSKFNEDIRHWDVRKVTDFSSMFKYNEYFAVDLTFWEIHASKHDDMFTGNSYYVDIAFDIDKIIPTALDDTSFQSAIDDWFGNNRDSVVATYGDISDWLTYDVTDMSGAFKDKEFNSDISRWVVSSVTDMSSMFEGSTFNSDISGWQVVNVESMNSMFKGSSFNQMIDRWNVSNVADMAHMFENSQFSRPIGDWDLFGTEPNEIQAANDDNNFCISPGQVVNLETYNRASLAARRQCFDICTGLYPISLPDFEGRNRYRGGGRVGKDYTPYTGGFGMVTNELSNHTCMCAVKTDECDSSPFDYVYDYRDMDTTDMFKGNTKFAQPLCGLGWRYRDLSSLTPAQLQMSTTCDICSHGQHMSECGVCLGEFRFDYCMDSPKGYTIAELIAIDPQLVIDDSGLGFTYGTYPDNYPECYPWEDEGDCSRVLEEVNRRTLRVNPEACNCEYEKGMRGCPIVNGRKMVRLEEWFAFGTFDFEEDLLLKYDSIEFYCELDFLNGRPVANAEGFNSVTCTDDTLLTRFECGLAGGNWDGECDKCLEPCEGLAFGEKVVSIDRECTVCPNGLTVFQNECAVCPDGQFTSEDFSYCGKCPQGTYGHNGECFTCEEGTVSEFEGAIQCNKCEADTYSIGTECLKCDDDQTSEPGSGSCVEKRHCWHGETSSGEEIGNFCRDCDSDFKLVDGTCVSKCQFGTFSVDESGTYQCECFGKWNSTYCDSCLPENDFTYMSPEMCVERVCNDIMVTDCFCTSKIVKDDEFCYQGRIVPRCEIGDSNCMCNMCDGYEYAPENTVCHHHAIYVKCELFNGINVPFEPCSNAGYSCESGLNANAVCTGAYHCEERHFEPNGDCCNTADSS